MSAYINIAERITKFEEKDFIANPRITGVEESLITDADWQEFSDKALTFTDGNCIYQFAEEYPIVRYQCKDRFDFIPDKRLNSFVKSITVSSTMYGKKISISAGKIVEKRIVLRTVVYYENNIGRRYAVPQYDIIKFLLKKPNLVVSSDGVLIFFTQKSIIATTDCEHYAWINPCVWNQGIDTSHSVIQDIEVYRGYCRVCMIDTTEVDENDKPIKHSFKLWFDINIDMQDSYMIKPYVQKI